MIHTPTIKATTGPCKLLQCRIDYEIAQAAYYKSLRLSQTRKQAELLPKLRAARHALLAAELGQI